MLKDRSLWIIILATIILLSIPLLARGITSTTLFTGPESYLNLRLASIITTEQTLPRHDPLSYGGRPLTQELGMPLLLALLPSALYPFLPLLLGVITMLILAALLAYHQRTHRILTLILLILSPTYLYLYSSLSKYTIAVPLFLAALLAYRRYYYKRALLFILLTTLFSTLSGIILLLLALTDLLRKQLPRKKFLVTLALTLALILMHHGHLLLGLPEHPLFPVPARGIAYLVHDFFAALGGASGLSIFTFLLSIAGIYYAKRTNYRYIPYYLLALLLFALTLFIPTLLHYLQFLVVYLAALTLVTHFHEPWRSPLLKKAAFTVLIIGLIISPYAYLTRIHTIPPTRALGDALTWLRAQPNTDTTLSTFQNGVYITAADKKNVIDENILYAPSLNERWDDTQTIFHSVTIEPTQTLLAKYNVRYILLDEKSQRQLWTSDERELPFLLKYGKGTFLKQYENAEVTIWEVF